MHENTNQLQTTTASFDLADLFSFLWQKKFRIIFTALIICAVGAYQISQLPRFYKASSTILLDTKNKNFNLPDPVSTLTAAGGDSQLETYIEYMHSRIFLETIVNDLSLTQHSEFRSKRQNADEQRHLDYAVSQLLYSLSISRLGETHLLKVSFESLSPEIAAEVSNYVGPAFFKFLDKMNQKRADEASAWLTNHISDLQDQLSVAEQAFQEFLRENQMIDTSSQISIANQEISDLLKRRGDNQKKIANFERALEQIEAANGDVNKLMSIPRFLNFPNLIELNNKIAARRQFFAELQDRYKYKHPKYIQAESSIEELQKEQRRAINRFIGAIKQDYGTLLLNRDTLELEIEEATAALSDLGADELKLTRLKREVLSTQKVYDAFLARLQETEILRELGQNEQYAVVDQAAVPTSPSKPRLSLLAAVTILLSVFLSVGLWLTIHIVNDKASRYRALLAKIATPVLAEFPRIASLKQTKGDMGVAEVVRSLRTVLMVSNQDKANRIILVTGIATNSGRSAVAIALAKAFGQLDKTLLLDADLRNPKLQKTFGLMTDHDGFTDFVNKRAKFSDCIQKVKDSQLSLMPSGARPKDPLIDLSKNRTAMILERLAVVYERVIIIAPAITEFSDALVLAKYADASVIVCDVEQNKAVELVDTVQRMQDVGAKNIGVVLNKSKSVKAQSVALSRRTFPGLNPISKLFSFKR